MAERKTFLFFCSWATVLKDFSPEDRCAIYDAIIAYVENGSLPELSPVLDMAFKFIRNDNDDMQSKYQQICEKRKEYARRGGLAKAANAKSKQMVANGNISNQKETNAAYNEHEHEHEHESRKNNINNILPPQDNNISRERDDVVVKNLRESIAKLKQNKIWLEQAQMKFKRNNDEIASDLDEFYQDVILRGTQVTNPQALFISWLGQRLHGSIKHLPMSPDPRLGVGEWRDVQGYRRYAQSDVIVPEDAPPRPSEKHYWSLGSRRWEDFI